MALCRLGTTYELYYFTTYAHKCITEQRGGLGTTCYVVLFLTFKVVVGTNQVANLIDSKGAEGGNPVAIKAVSTKTA